ncbi:hypothetical protein Y023_1416 [Burkholderia pseudomallei A79D]|nr:hypothetical protein X993_5984 [Burkholderia pseudomallei K42]AIV86511.1 hypothetical protein X995_4126 [Burkholderia pseudomallei B03]AIV92981.1 hypothetical protein X996_4379 [Burkholderia pseudomallei A79A]KGV06138.1 hypothetical protein X881_5993 [Burkholderia pseudomallei MSHR4300]KGX94397.1 hypothetical protein Y023_1416 [Burkholderia pseudomallei A79D]KGX95748.1 hypothetical protein X997_1247 [Burkholderia pseudomallei A79C]CAJ4270504.1 Uncharacterised protein [Burkholderia pseudoma
MHRSDQNRNCCGNIFAVGMETLFSPPTSFHHQSEPKIIHTGLQTFIEVGI